LWGTGDSAAGPLRRGHRHGRVPQRLRSSRDFVTTRNPLNSRSAVD
jgi:hypothetical protein